jgi:enoyl-CoA hydratase/carnithine racemase
MGAKQVNEFAMLGTMVPAAEAKRLGLVNRVVPREKLDDAAMQMANELLLKNPWALARIKWLVYRQSSLSMEQAVEVAHDQQSLWLQLPDVKEGVTAFMGKRKPDHEQFKGKTKYVSSSGETT